MICNELYNGQGLGNQLWNYVVARIIAKEKGFPFSIIGRSKFKGKDFMVLDFGMDLQDGISFEGGPPYKLPKGIQHYYKEKRENLLHTQTDITRTDTTLFNIQPNTKFDGNCQSTKYLAGHREDVLSWIKIKSEYSQHTTDEDTCIIHMRCGDFANLKDVFLPVTYYEQAMMHVKKIHPQVKFCCITDQAEKAREILPGVEIIGSAVLDVKDSNQAGHHVGGPVGIDFSLLTQAKYLIIPNSSFSWWAAYLNTRRSVVVAPKYWARYNTSDGYWSTSDIVTDDFTYLDKNGTSFTAEECWEEKNNFESSHSDSFVTVETIHDRTLTWSEFTILRMREKILATKIKIKEWLKKILGIKKIRKV